MATDTVMVGCKMPTGVVLNLTRYEILSKEHGLVQRVGEEDGSVSLKGNAVKFGQADISINGYVFTKVPKAFWDEWLARNASSSLLKDGYIKPAATVDAAQRIAREHEKERGQFPRLEENDPRTRSLGVKKFDAKDEGAARAA